MRYRWISLVMVVALAAPAWGHGRTVLDPDDSAGPLDVVAARIKHPGGEMKLRLVTYERWDSSILGDDLDFVSFEFDDPARAGIERCVVVRAGVPQGESPASFEGPVYEDCGRPLPYHSEVGTVTRFHRPDDHGIEIWLDADVLWERPPASFRWRALTSFEDEDHPGCEPPDPMPPEHFYGTCSDWTTWNTHTSRG